MDMKGWVQVNPPRIGTLLTVDHLSVIEIARLAGFDWLWIDGEHGCFNESSAALASAASTGGPRVFVRLPDRSTTNIKRYLEAGCAGIIVPQVSTLDEVNEIARAALYPPRGERSIGVARAQGYGASFTEYLRTRSYDILVQIESVAGVRNAREIIAHEAVDAVLIGPYDLSSSFGIPGEIESPQVTESIAKVLALCKQAGKPCGIFAATAEKARACAAMGFDLICVGIDTSVLLNAFNSLLGSLRQN